MTLIFSTRNSSLKDDKKDNNSRSIFTTSKTPSTIGPYSKAYFAGDLLFCSGQIGLLPETMSLINGGIEEETKQTCRNIVNLLVEYKLSTKDVVKTTIYLKNINDFDKFNEIYQNYFIMKPARTVVEVSNLPKGALIEIEAIAIKGNEAQNKIPIIEKQFEEIK